MQTPFRFSFVTKNLSIPCFTPGTWESPFLFSTNPSASLMYSLYTSVVSGKNEPKTKTGRISLVLTVSFLNPVEYGLLLHFCRSLFSSGPGRVWLLLEKGTFLETF